MPPTESFMRTVRYLRMVRKKLEFSEVETISPSLNAPYQHNAEDSQDIDEGSSSRSTSSTPRSRSSSMTAQTSASEMEFNNQLEAEQTNGTSYREDFKTTMDFIARRVTEQIFRVVMDIAYRPLGEVGEHLANALADTYQTVNLGYCETLKRLHTFQEGKRCHRCDAQLCKACEECILKRCIQTTEKHELLLEPIPLSQPNVQLLADEYGVKSMPFSHVKTEKPNLDWLPRDSLAARRIAANCHRRRCFLHFEAGQPCPNTDNKCLYHHRHLTFCTCTEFLMKPDHDCEKGEFHFCKNCCGSILSDLTHSNTKTIWFKTKSGGEEGLSQYTCGSGFASRSYLSTLCKICDNPCARQVINDLSSSYKVNGGMEGDTQGWNRGVCPWMFSLIPGAEGSFPNPDYLKTNIV